MPLVPGLVVLASIFLARIGLYHIADKYDDWKKRKTGKK